MSFCKISVRLLKDQSTCFSERNGDLNWFDVYSGLDVEHCGKPNQSTLEGRCCRCADMKSLFMYVRHHRSSVSQHTRYGIRQRVHCFKTVTARQEHNMARTKLKHTLVYGVVYSAIEHCAESI